jgi:hypothetical protein
MKRGMTRIPELGLLLAALMATADPAKADDFRPEPGYTSLFNGKDLTGWYYKPNPKVSLEGKTETPDRRFQVVDGVIVANEGKGIRDLYTVRNFPRSFHLRLEFRAGLKADSGVYLRGPQLQVRDFIRRNEHREFTRFKNDGWNELDITVRNGVVTATVNGKVLGDKDFLELTFNEGKPKAKLNGQAIDVKSVNVAVGARAECLCNGEKLETMRNIPPTGGIGLQAETGKFEFRHIRVKELD